MSNLIPVEKANPAALFKDGAIDQMLEKISAEAKSLTQSLSVDNADDRKEIASVAYKVARSKTTIDNAGKDLVSDLKKQTKAIDLIRKMSRDYLDNLKSEIRQPLDEWESKEKARVDSHINAINELRTLGDNASEWMSYSCEDLREFMTILKTTDFSEFEEFSEDAKQTVSSAVAKVSEAIDKRRSYDDEQAELARLRQEAAERERKKAAEREEQARKDREEQIRRDAAEAEKRKADARELALVEQKEAAERERIAAEERAKYAAEQAEREIKAKQAREADEQRKREANTRHRGKVNREAAAAISKAIGCSEANAKKLVTAIHKGLIPHVTVNY